MTRRKLLSGIIALLVSLPAWALGIRPRRGIKKAMLSHFEKRAESRASALEKMSGWKYLQGHKWWGLAMWEKNKISEITARSKVPEAVIFVRGRKMPEAEVSPNSGSLCVYGYAFCEGKIYNLHQHEAAAILMQCDTTVGGRAEQGNLQKTLFVCEKCDLIFE
jgi:hypothetical protein